MAGNVEELVKVGRGHRQIIGGIAPLQRAKPEQKCLETLAVENSRAGPTVKKERANFVELGANVTSNGLVAHRGHLWGGKNGFCGGSELIAVWRTMHPKVSARRRTKRRGGGSSPPMF